MKTFLGNFGGTHTVCDHQRLQFQFLDIHCDNGMVLNANRSLFGVISNEFKFFGYCTEKELEREIEQNSYQSCSRHMDKQVVARIKNEMMQSCHHQESCQIDFRGIMNSADNAMASYCNEQAYFYVQAPCVIPQEDLVPRRVKGLVISCISVAVILFSFTYIQYLKGVQKLKYVKYDFSTLFTADYSIEFQIKQGMWTTFYEQYYDHKSPISDIS